MPQPIYTYLHPPQGIKPSQILRAEKLEILIHMSTGSRASNQEKISPRKDLVLN
jgi:hypothetical protein